MLSKISVKKPMTVLVAVVLILVLGVVSFTRMTPDLLPNMDFPYAMILTTYIGQTPETVEATVTKPLEQSVYTIDGVKQVQSTSTDNYSMCIIEFQDGTDMNAATVDVRSALDTLSDSWDDAVGTPYLIKVNPNILPVAMMAVDYEGKDRREISDFVGDTLLNRLEGVDGVASVSNKGVVTEKENVVLSQERLTSLMKKSTPPLICSLPTLREKSILPSRSWKTTPRRRKAARRLSVIPLTPSTAGRRRLPHSWRRLSARRITAAPSCFPPKWSCWIKNRL